VKHHSLSIRIYLSLQWTDRHRSRVRTWYVTGCKGGVTRWEEGRALVFANAGTCHGRIDTTVRLSL
jgi:hypothetical protein